MLYLLKYIKQKQLQQELKEHQDQGEAWWKCMQHDDNVVDADFKVEEDKEE